MRKVVLFVILLAVIGLGTHALVASGGDAGPPCDPDPNLQCLNYVDPVVCTVICKGGPQQQTFTNQCFATCSGLKFRGACQPTGG